MSRQIIIEVATAEIGVFEFPDGSNKTPYGEWFGLNGKEWCGMFCSWVYAHAGHSLGILDFQKGFASVPFALKYWKAREKVTTDPLPGDLVIFDYQKGKQTETEWSPDHVGFFLGWLDRAAGLFETIEGNTSIKNQSNGGQVMKRQRNMAFVQAFVNPLGLPADDEPTIA